MRIGVGLSIPELATRGGRFSPASLFTGGVQGAWYAPDDFSTLFQDSAGTTPVTAVEQPVGLMLDKSQGGRQSLAVTGWAKTSGDGTVTVDGNTITITGATTTTRVDIASPGWVVGDYADITVTGSVAGATGQTLFLGGGTAYTSLSGTNTFRNVIASSTLLRLQINTGSATFVVTSRGYVPGNHASQATAASRPVLRARYNQLTYSEQFDNAAWTKNGVTVTANTATAPDGTVTADTITVNALTTARYVRQFSTLSAATYTFSYVLKYTGSQRYLSLTLYDTVYKGCVFDIQNGAVTFSQSATGSVIDLGSGWYRCTIVATVSAGTVYYDLNPTNSSTAIAPVYIGNGTDNFYVWGADLRTGSSAGTYQRIAAATDYATAGFLPYLAFDGTDDFMVTGNINLSGTDKANVLFGATQLSAANYGGVASFGPTVNDAGSFLVWLRSTAGGGQVESYARGSTSGTTGSMTTNAALAVPSTFVWSTLYDIGQSTIAAEIIQRQNGAAVASTGGSTAGTGNFGNLALHIGRYNATNYLNGRLYQMIIPGKALSASELASAETWNATKTGVTL